MNWVKVNNSSEVKPAEIEYSPDGIYYARINFSLKTRTDEEGNEYEYWEYEETTVSEREYSEVAILNEFLNKTDYIWNAIREGAHDESYYTETIANRKAWRERIQELQNN